MADYRKLLADAIAHSIEESGGLPWSKMLSHVALRPFNAKNGSRFKSGNVLQLLQVQVERGSDDPRWMTLDQANKAGYWIRKGAKPTYVEFWTDGRPLAAPVPADHGTENVHVVPEAEAEEKAASVEPVRPRSRVLYAKFYNAIDIVGLPPLKYERGWEPQAVLNRLLASSEAQIRGSASTPVSSADLPARDRFKSDREYDVAAVRALASRAIHAIGSVRTLTSDVGDSGLQVNARQSLSVEIAAMYLSALVGVNADARPDAHNAEAWSKLLKQNKHELFWATKDADRIVEYIFDAEPELRDELEGYIEGNVLPNAPLRRALDSGISKDLPNFISADAKPKESEDKPNGVGRDDARWRRFEKALRESAQRQSVKAATVEHALAMVARDFTEAMDKAAEQGFGAEDMCEMLAQRVVVDMINLDKRDEQWQRFSERVHRVGDAHVAVEAIDIALKEMHGKYVALLGESARQNWATETAKQAIINLVFGEDAEPKIDLPYVQKLVQGCDAARVFVGADADDVVLSVSSVSAALDDEDVILGPIGSDDDLLEDAVIPEI